MLNQSQIDILKAVYVEKLSDIRQRKEFDFKLVREYVVLNLVCAGYLITSPIAEVKTIIAVSILLGAIALLATVMIARNTKRHKVVGESIRNITKALGLDEKGAYIEGASIEPQENRSHSAWDGLYYSLIWLFFLAQGLILFHGIKK